MLTSTAPTTLSAPPLQAQKHDRHVFLAQILGHKLLGPNASLSVGAELQGFLCRRNCLKKMKADLSNNRPHPHPGSSRTNASYLPAHRKRRLCPASHDRLTARYPRRGYRFARTQLKNTNLIAHSTRERRRGRATRISEPFPSISFCIRAARNLKGRSATRDFVALAENGRRSLRTISHK